MPKKFSIILDSCHMCPFLRYVTAGTGFAKIDRFECTHDDSKIEGWLISYKNVEEAGSLKNALRIAYPAGFPTGCPLPDTNGIERAVERLTK